MSSPYQSPISQPNVDRTGLPLWENLLSGAVLLASAAYAVACVVHIVTVNAIVTLAHQELAGNPPTVATVQSKASLEDHVNTIVNVLFWVMYLLFIVWMISLNSRFRDAGRGSALRSLAAWKIWRVGVLVSLVLVVVLRTHTGDGSLSSAIANAHQEMIYLGVRAAIGCLYVWCALGMRKAALSLTAAPQTHPAQLI